MDLLKKNLRSTLIILLILTLLLPLSVNYQTVFARTNGVVQSRRTASVDEFPESYQPGLSVIKKTYPNASFIYYDTGLSWEEIMSSENEMRIGMNLVPSYEPSSWKSINPEVYDASTDIYAQIEPGWNAASKEIIEYYMDPRNFFDEDQIFQFLQLTYNGSETVDGVEKIIHNSFMSNESGAVVVDDSGNSMTYAQAFIQIGKLVGVSPYMLASRVLQEQGPNGSALCLGNCTLANGAYYGYYDFFNIYAFGSTSEDIITAGLSYAKSHDWNTIWRSLLGGGQVVAQDYVEIGKDTLYLQHFNFVADEHGSVGYSPYMTSTITPYCEAQKVRSSCNDKNAKYVFVIPVFKDIPEAICEQPNGDGHGSPILKNISIEGQELDFEPEILSYEIAVNKDVTYLTLKAEAYNEVTFQVNETNKEENVTSVEKGVSLSFGDNKILIHVTSSDGRSRAYLVNIMRDSGDPWYRVPKLEMNDENVVLTKEMTIQDFEKSSKHLHCSIEFLYNDSKVRNNGEYIATNDTFIIRNEKGSIIYQNRVVLKGDINSDGHIDDKDAQILANDIFGTKYINNFMKIVADIDESGTLDEMDLLEISEHIPYEEANYEEMPTFTINASDNPVTFGNYEVKLNVCNGNYVSNGYLVYNKNIFDVENTNNDGSIHFLVVNGKTYFENNKDKVIFTPLVEDADFTISTRYVSTYRKDIDDFVFMNDDSVSGKISDDMFLLEEISSASYEYDADPILTCSLKGNKLKSGESVDLSLPEGLTFENGEKNITVSLEKETTVKIFQKEKKTGNYSVTIDTQIGDKTEQYLFEYTIIGCDHFSIDPIFKNYETHSFTCSKCGYYLECQHNWILSDNKTYKCQNCGVSVNANIKLSVKTAKINQSAKIEASVLLDDKEYNGNVNYYWFLDYKQIGTNQKNINYTFFDYNVHTLMCVVKLENGIELFQSQPIHANDMPSEIKISAISCDRIILNGINDAKYKINGRDWQDYPLFSGLNPNTTYTVQIKLKDKIYSAKLTTIHTYSTVSFEPATCQNNAYFDLSCPDCETHSKVEIKGTQLEHSYSSFDKVQSANCQHGTAYAIKCVNGCESVQRACGDDIKCHKYKSFTFNNDATCTKNGTETSYCVYCNNELTREASNTATGHLYTLYKSTDTHHRQSNCRHGCGSTNELLLVDKEITYLSVQIGDISVGQSGLSTVKVLSEGVSYNNYKLTVDNKIFTKESAKSIIEADKQYVLSELSFKIAPGCCFGEKIIVYINGELSHCQYEIKENILKLKDVGRFET